ncbi:hypothetical protein GDO81_005931 [Engystomops pustulosus]|uniref:Uncharacterized protein n=1 Tax=Engystomops pustulosus TaxID=76066 RepID=A0AAV7CW17_ENGPU|nr:hypothetical protein GDO81_005931 [Engystomops pustulosus]
MPGFRFSGASHRSVCAVMPCNSSWAVCLLSPRLSSLTTALLLCLELPTDGAMPTDGSSEEEVEEGWEEEEA